MEQGVCVIHSMNKCLKSIEDKMDYKVISKLLYTAMVKFGFIYNILRKPF